VYLAAVVVGTSHSRLALRRLLAGYGRAAGAAKVRALRQRAPGAGDRRPRYLVLLRPAAFHHPGLAQADAGSQALLAYLPAADGLRDSLLLCGADDHVRLPLHDAAAPARTRGRGRVEPR